MKIKNILIVAGVCAAFSACSEDELKTYDGKDFIYFGNRIVLESVYWDTVKTFNFFFEPDMDEAVLDVKVSRGGMAPADEDKEFIVEIDILSGQEGRDFDVDRVHVMPKGRSYMNIPVKLYRSDALEDNTFEFDITLLPNENFTLDLPEVYQSGDTIQRTTMRISYSNLLLAPTIWKQREATIGYFSRAKFDEFTSLFGLTIDDWTDTKGKFIQNWNNYINAFAAYLNSKIAEGPDVAVKDPDKSSWRGYMTLPRNEYDGMVQILPVEIPDYFPTTNEWEGR